MKERVWFALVAAAAVYASLRTAPAHACLEPLLLSDNNNYINNTDICTVPTTQPGSNNGIADYVSGGSKCDGVNPSALCRDYWKLTLSDWANVTINMDTLSSDVDLYLYNGDLNEIASSTNSGTTAEQLTVASLTPGTYYVLVGMYGTADSNYRVWATATKLCNEASTSGDLNNAYNESKVCRLPTTGSYSGNINASVDTIDWWSASTSSTGKFTVQLTGLSANVDLDLYDSGPSTLLDSSAGTGNADEWVDSGSTALSARTFYVRARTVGSASTTYTLKTFYCSEPDSSANDRNNGPFGSAICPLPTTGAVQSGAFNSTTDKNEDYWKMVVASSGSVSVKVDLTGLAVDCDLYVYDETYETVLGSSAASGTANESVTVSLSPGTYVVWVNDYANGTTTYSLSAQIQGDSTPPGAPTGPAWADGSTSSDLNITATWTAPTDPSGIADYRLQVCEYSSPTTPNFGTCTTRFNGLIGSNTVSYTLTSGQNGIALDKFYYFHVAAKDGAGNEGSYSAASGYVNTVDTAPPDFAGLEAAGDPGKGGVVDLQWAAASDASPPITYNIYYSTTSGGQNYSSPTFSTTSTSYRVSGLTNGTTYYFVVRAKDNLNQEESNTVQKSAAPSATFISCSSSPNALPHDFEANNGGWTNSSAEFAWGTPTGSGGSGGGNPDPPSGYGATSGNGKVWGNNLSGDYPNNKTTNLTSVAFNCANRSTLKIRYRRWLNHQGNGYDVARIQACAGGGCSFTDVWTSGATAGSGSTRDGSWVLHEVAPSPANAWDGQTSLQIRFNLVTDTALTFSGWNIDDFDIGGVSTDTSPPTFSGLSTAAAGATSGTVDLTWTAATDAEGSTPVTYNIYRGSSGFSPGPGNALPPGGFSGTSYTDSGLSAGTQYCYVARARDAMGNQEGNSVERCATPTTASPNAPASPAQTDSADTPIGQGGSITSNTVKLKATVSDPDAGDTVKLEVEVKAVGITFDGSISGSSALVSNGATATVTLTFSNASYHWRGRAVDSSGSAGNWAVFGTNSDPNDTDFTTNGSAPDLILAAATDTAGTPTAGLSAGDRVILHFSSATNQTACPGVITYLLLSNSHTWGSGPSCAWDSSQQLTITPGSGATVAAGDSITVQNAGCASSICDSGNTNIALGSPPNISGTFDASVRSLSVIRGALQAYGANIWSMCSAANSDYDLDGAGFLGTFVLSREGAAGSGDSLYAINQNGTGLVSAGSAAVDTLCGGACGDGVGTPWHYTQDWGANTCAGTEKEWYWFGTTTGKTVGATFAPGTGFTLQSGYPYSGGGTECSANLAVPTFAKITTGVQGDNEMIYFGAQDGGGVDYVCSVCWRNDGPNYCKPAVCWDGLLTAPRAYDCVNVDANPPTEDSTAMQYDATVTNLRVYFAGSGSYGVSEYRIRANGVAGDANTDMTNLLNKSIGAGYAVYGLPWMHITQARFYVPTASGSAGALQVFKKSDFTDYTNFSGGYTGGGSVGPSKALEPWLAYGGIFFGDENGKLHCVVESTGAACTGFPVQPDGTNPIRTQPVVYKGVLYFSNTAGKVFAYDITTNCCTLKSPVQLTTNGYPFNLGVNLAGSLVPNLDYSALVVGGVGGNVWYLPMWTSDPTP